MILFHASDIEIKVPDVYHSREFLDFGKGFYLTAIEEQAYRYASRFLLKRNVAYVNQYLLDDNYLQYKVKTFTRYDEEWLNYIGACRRGLPCEQFDVVEGGIADDKVFNTVDLYLSGDMSKEDALRRLSFEKPNHQLCILNQDVIEHCLHFMMSHQITK
jgi:hypothetical protein